jgi:hypothetical protein
MGTGDQVLSMESLNPLAMMFTISSSSSKAIRFVR